MKIVRSVIFVLIILIGAEGFSQTTAPPGKYFFKLQFNQSMDTTSLKDESNYTIFDQNMNEIPVLGIATMYDRNSSVCMDSSIILLVDAPDYKTSYMIRVDNVYNKAGDLISDSANSLWFYFDGFDPGADKPVINIRR